MAKSVEEGRLGRIIGRVLPGVVKLWLQTQVEQVDSLAVDLLGRDRQLLSGCIPSVTVSAKRVIYKGIQLSSVRLGAEDIRINLGQVVRGKALRLTKRFPVKGEVVLSDADIAASVSSPLLAEGLADFWRSLIRLPDFAEAVAERYGDRALQPDTQLHQPSIKLGDGYLALSFYPQSQGEIDERPIILGATLAVMSGHWLVLGSPCWLDSVSPMSCVSGERHNLEADIKKGEPIEALSDFRWDLGEDTQITRLSLQASQLTCEGQVLVKP